MGIRYIYLSCCGIYLVKLLCELEIANNHSSPCYIIYREQMDMCVHIDVQQSLLSEFTCIKWFSKQVNLKIYYFCL